MEEDKKQKHIVLIHGAGHGAWCWYKVATQLRSQRHRVTALDMAAAGVNTQPLSELSSYSDYQRPLMEFLEALRPEEWVILVGHSMGGVCISLAMEKFPQKIRVAVFVTAAMPGPNLRLQEWHHQVGFFGNNVEFSGKKLRFSSSVYTMVEKDDLSKNPEWIIKNNPPDEVKTICGSDHMFM